MRRLRIGIDAHILGKRKGGVETCLLAIVRTLARLDSHNEYFVYVTARCPLKAAELPSNFHLRSLPIENPWFERLLLLPYFYRADRLDVIHVQRAIPPWGCARAVLHLHDAAHMVMPSVFPPWKRWILTRVFRSSGRRAARVVTPSACAGADLARYYAIDPAKIDVVPNGLDLNTSHGHGGPTSTEEAQGRFEIREPYAIYVGAVERNKNIRLLIDAFHVFQKDFPVFKLVIAGKASDETRAGYARELRTRAAELRIAEKIVFTGYLAGSDLTALLSGARMLVLPSTGEGFGFTPLEAMACGVPAITADTPVSHEVYGDAVLRAVPDDACDLARQMTALARDPELAAACVERGRRRTRECRWENACARLIEVYARAAGGPL